MFWLILGSVIGCLVAIRIAMTEVRRDKNASFLAALIAGIIVYGAVGTFLGYVAGCTAGCLGSPCCPQELVLVEEIQLESFGDYPDLEGEFFLGYSKVFTGFRYEFYYVYCYQTEQGASQLNVIPAEYGNVFIHQEDRENGVIKIYRSMPRNKWAGFPGFCQRLRYDIYIPKGSIAKNYKLDLE